MILCFINLLILCSSSSSSSSRYVCLIFSIVQDREEDSYWLLEWFTLSPAESGYVLQRLPAFAGVVGIVVG